MITTTVLNHLRRSDSASITSSSSSTLVEEKLKKLDSSTQLGIHQLIIIDHGTYCVKPSDTLAAIALTFGMTLTELKKLNQIFHTGQLIPGTVLIVNNVNSTVSHRRDSLSMRSRYD